MSPRLLPLFVLGSLAGCASGQESAPTRRASEPGAPVEIPFLRHANQIMIPVQVNGHGPHGFTLDTGSGMTVCVDSALATELELPVTGSVGNSGATGRVVQRDLVGLETIALGGVELESREALSADYSWISPAGSPAVEGILGFPLFRDSLLTIDYPRRVVRLAQGTLSADSEHVASYSGQGRRPHVTIEVGGESLTAIIDTGSTSGIVLPDRLRSSLPVAADPVVIGRVRSVNGVGGRVWRARLRVPVTLAGHTLEAPTVAFYEEDDDAALGSAVLNTFALTFDQKQRLVEFAEPERAAPEPERR